MVLHQWCAVDDGSDQQTTSYLTGNDFTAYIIESQDGYFYCESGIQWLHAVPIEIRAITYAEAIFMTS